MNLSLIIVGLLTAVTIPEILQAKIVAEKVGVMRVSCVSAGCLMVLAGVLLGF